MLFGCQTAIINAANQMNREILHSVSTRLADILVDSTNVQFERLVSHIIVYAVVVILL